MTDAGRRRLRLATLTLALGLPLLAVGLVGYLAFSGTGEAGETPVAALPTAGGFHPIAGTFAPNDVRLASCGRQEYSCLEQGFGNVAYARGPRVALTLFDERLVTDKDVEVDCHRIAHTIGSAAFARFHGDVAKTFSRGSATCASGYYHGVLERAFVGVQTKAELASVARSLCDAAGIRARSFLDYQCEHGLGHGLMIQTGFDLPLALSLCAQLQTGWDGVVCSSGVFMENGNARFGFRSSWLKDDDPLYPCDVVKARDKRSCYARASTRVLELNGSDFDAAAAKCASAGSRWGRYCFRGYGRDAAAAVRFDVAKTLSLCNLAGRNRNECLYGAARTFADNFGSSGLDHAAALCARAPVSGREACVRGIGLFVGLVDPTDQARRRTCRRVALGYAEECFDAAVAEVDPRGREAWG
jgi:hypothetical protein